MVKIVVTNDQDLTEAQYQRLNSLGEVTYYDSTPSSADEYLARVCGADIICSGTAGLKDAFPRLNNVYLSVPFVSVAFLDLQVLRANNVALSNAPGANRHAVSEWVMAMMISLMRSLPDAINRSETFRRNGSLPPTTPGLAGKSVTILGYGNVGKRVGELAAAFDMNVSYFKRGDDLRQAVHNADVVVDTLSSNPATHKLLDKEFFDSLKQGSYFITVSRSEVVDDDAMLKALDERRLNGIANDCGGSLIGDTDDPLYQKLLRHPKVLVTPHIAYNSEMAGQLGAEIMIDNVEAWINGRPQNLLT